MSVPTNGLYNMKEGMTPIKDNVDKWLEPEDHRKQLRLTYIKSFNKPQPNKCPECGSQLSTTIDESETICTQCGLITSASIEYVAGIRIHLPYGKQ